MCHDNREVEIKVTKLNSRENRRKPIYSNIQYPYQTGSFSHVQLVQVRKMIHYYTGNTDTGPIEPLYSSPEPVAMTQYRTKHVT